LTWRVTTCPFSTVRTILNLGAAAQPQLPGATARAEQRRRGVEAVAEIQREGARKRLRLGLNRLSSKCALAALGTVERTPRPSLRSSSTKRSCYCRGRTISTITSYRTPATAAITSIEWPAANSLRISSRQSCSARALTLGDAQQCFQVVRHRRRRIVGRVPGTRALAEAAT
jgi:hypothetical protein